MKGLHMPRRGSVFLLGLAAALLTGAILLFWYDEQHKQQQTTLSVCNSTGSAGTQQVDTGEPLILLSNNGYHGDQDWASRWDSVEGSTVVKTLQDCPAKCLFTSDLYFLKSADLVLVSLAYYDRDGGKPV